MYLRLYLIFDLWGWNYFNLPNSMRMEGIRQNTPMWQGPQKPKCSLKHQAILLSRIKSVVMGSWQSSRITGAPNCGAPVGGQLNRDSRENLSVKSMSLDGQGGNAAADSHTRCQWGGLQNGWNSSNSVCNTTTCHWWRGGDCRLPKAIPTYCKMDVL